MRAESETLASDLVIVGLPLATAPDRIASQIPAHWQRFFAEGVLGRLPPRRDEAHLYAVYCDYESDERGTYTMVIGAEVGGDAPVPTGLRRVRLPTGRYASFAFDGDPTKAVWGAWSHVNGAWPERSRRRFIADAERYDAASMAPDSMRGAVLVGVAP